MERLEERVVELESRLAFQDQLVEDLNEVIITMDRRVDLLESELLRLKRRLDDLLLNGGDGE